MVQGPGGQGPSSVLGDTWWFNLYTREWAVATAGAGAAPAASHLQVAAPEGAGAVAFGGRSGGGAALGRLYTFDPAAGWSEGALRAWGEGGCRGCWGMRGETRREDVSEAGFGTAVPGAGSLPGHCRVTAESLSESSVPTRTP